MTDEWRPVVGWEGFYEISAGGKVRSINRIVHFSDGRVRQYAAVDRAAHTDGFGYRKVTLKRAGKQVRALVHQLVAAAWIGPRPSGMEVCHNDGDKTNNRRSNLRYDTRKANHEDAVRHGTARRPRRLTDEQVADIRAQRGQLTCYALAQKHGTSPAHVCNIQRGHRRTT